MTSLSKTISSLWSLVVGLKITGIEFFKPKLTVHYPRKEVTNLPTYRGHIDLVARDDDPLTPRCIMCGICVESCPSSCLSFDMHVVDGQDKAKRQGPGELYLGLGVPLPGSVKKDPSPEKIERALDGFRLNYNLCSLCGLCVQRCPVSSLAFSHEAYLAGRTRQEFEFDLLGRLRNRAAAKRGVKAA